MNKYKYNNNANMGVSELTKSNDGRNARQIGVADTLRDGQTGDGDTGNDVGFEKVESVIGSPLKNGDEVFEPEKDLGE